MSRKKVLAQLAVLERTARDRAAAVKAHIESGSASAEEVDGLRISIVESNSEAAAFAAARDVVAGVPF
jgi:hypothetical protein